jgi:hypothetical protein
MIASGKCGSGLYARTVCLMQARMFSLVSAADDTMVFAWGIEIIDEEMTEAIIYRRDRTIDAGYMFGTHRSAENALKRYSQLAPMRLIWESDEPGEAADPAPPQH